MAGARAQLEQAARLLERVVAGFEPERLDADGALAYLALFARSARSRRRVRRWRRDASMPVARTGGAGIRPLRTWWRRRPGSGSTGPVRRSRSASACAISRWPTTRSAGARCRSTRRRRSPKRPRWHLTRKPASWRSRHGKQCGTCASARGRFGSRPSVTARNGTSGSSRCGPSGTASTVTGW